MSVSVVVPCYNEEKNLVPLIEACATGYAANGFELILVDNGSSDNSFSVMCSLAEKYDWISIKKLEKNLGYGGGILAGLSIARYDYIGWSHADLQTDLNDVIECLQYIPVDKDERGVFIKGRRHSRPKMDVLFTTMMSVCALLLLKEKMWDINAQPTIFHKDFFHHWKKPPTDFSLDAYAFLEAKKQNLNEVRFPVKFGPRLHGSSNWNTSFKLRVKFIKRTLKFLIEMRANIGHGNH